MQQLLAGGVATPPFAPQGLQHMVYVPKPSPSSSSSMDDPHHPPPPPISPSTLHGERLYSANHEFTRGGGGGGGGGTYGAIGSHVVTTTTTGEGVTGECVHVYVTEGLKFSCCIRRTEHYATVTKRQWTRSHDYHMTITQIVTCTYTLDFDTMLQ